MHNHNSMKREETQNYIKILLNRLDTEKEEAEIQSVILLLMAYMAGLERKPLDLEKLVAELDIEKEIPAEYHTLVAQLAIIKSKLFQRTSDVRIIYYLTRNVQKLLEEFRKYLTPQV